MLGDLSRSPWWLSVVVAAFVFVMARFVLPGMLTGPMFTPLSRLISFAGTALAVLFLIPGAISFVRGRWMKSEPQNSRSATTSSPVVPVSADVRQNAKTDTGQAVFKSEYEKVVYEAARELWPDCFIVPNASLQTVFGFDKMKSLIGHDPELFGYYLKSMVDICVYESDTYIPLFAIEVDGERYHASDNSRLRDKKKDDIFRKGDVPLVRLRMDRLIEGSALKEKLLKAKQSLNETVRQVTVTM
jgi:hypothetical protein